VSTSIGAHPHPHPHLHPHTMLASRSLVLRLLGSVLALTALAAQAAVSAPSPTEEPAVPPSMNRHYLDADVPQWRSIFEGSGREVFDQRFRVVEALELEPGMRVADIGAGTGLYTMLFARAVGDQGKVYAVDISPTFVESIEERAAAYRVDNIIGIVNAEHSAELPPGAVDLVFLADTYHHFAYPQSMLRSMHQALVPGGTLAIIDFRRQPGFSSPWVMGHVRAGREQVINEVQRAGFVYVDEPVKLKTNYFLRFRKLGD
jgi:SAM-dependent methyltransferase